MQAAADLARTGDWSVLWRPSPELGAAPQVIGELPIDRNWLIVADDAESLVEDVWASAKRLHETGRTNVFFLLASRDTDWRAAHGDQKAWDTQVHRLRDIVLAGVSLDDAGVVVDAWAAQGSLGLRALASEPERERQVRALFDATQAQDRDRGNGSFFGGLLATRFDEPALRAHVISLLDRLWSMRVEGGNGTLVDALLYVAACHAVGIPGVDKYVLAELLDVPRDWVASRVVRPLGAEVGAVQSAGHVLTRHRRVASAIVVECETHFNTDLGEVWARLIRETVRCGREGVVGRQSHGAIIHAGPRLQRALPEALQEERRKQIAIGAAQAAYEHQSEWLGCVVDLGRTLRQAGKPQEGADVLRRDLSKARLKTDYRHIIRGYFYEWSTCAGKSSDYVVDAWLACVSLCDQLAVPIEAERVKLSCAGLGVAFGELAKARGDPVFQKARRAVTELGWLATPDPRTAGYLDRYEDELDAQGVAKPTSVAQALEWLADGAAAAYSALGDNFLRDLGKGLGKGRPLTFQILAGTLGTAPANANVTH
jgi:hypothetical protein